MAVELTSIPFGAFGPDLDKIIESVANKIEREWPRGRGHPGSRQVLLAMVKVADNTYDTIRFFAADEPANLKRKAEYALSISPLSRTLLDSLFTIVFLFGDLAGRTDWYYRSGWREVLEEHKRIADERGDDPEWKEWLAQQRSFLDKIEVDWGITPEEIKTPASVPYWPNPGQMLKLDDLGGERREFLKYMSDKYYKVFSQDSHLSWPGLVRRSFALLPDGKDESLDLPKFKSDAVMVTVILVLCILSELELELGFGLDKRLQYVWGIVKPASEDAADIYKRFYGRFFDRV